ncbi:MAG: hypothetical protein ACR2K2_11375 [Mycobacteriales bacterium]
MSGRRVLQLLCGGMILGATLLLLQAAGLDVHPERTLVLATVGLIAAAAVIPVYYTIAARRIRSRDRR